MLIIAERFVSILLASRLKCLLLSLKCLPFDLRLVGYAVTEGYWRAITIVLKEIIDKDKWILSAFNLDILISKRNTSSSDKRIACFKDRIANSERISMSFKQLVKTHSSFIPRLQKLLMVLDSRKGHL